jgi:hypothetical protein
MGANSFKEAKAILRNELIQAHGDRFIDGEVAPADKISNMNKIKLSRSRATPTFTITRPAEKVFLNDFDSIKDRIQTAYNHQENVERRKEANKHVTSPKGHTHRQTVPR